MADTITSLSLITLAQEYRGDTVRQINRRTMFLRLVRIVTGEGKNVAWAPEADGQVAENYTEGADATNFGGDAQASAVLNWGLYRANIHVSNLSMDASATAATPMGNRRLWARQVVNGSAKAASAINKDCFSGAGTGTLICGLDQAIGSTSNVYAGVDRSQAANAYFRPTVVDPGTPTALTFKDIRDDMRQIYEACGENPDVAVCAPSVFNAVGALFDNTRRQVDQIETARGQVRLSGGFQAIEFDGMFFVKDKDATAGQIYYLNSNHLELQVLPPASLREFLENAEQELQADDGFGAVPLMMIYEMLAKQGASERAQIRCTPQLKVDRPNAMGVRKNVLTT